MRMRLQKELDKLKRMVLSLGAMVEENLRRASNCVEEKSIEIGKQVVKADVEIDENEVEVEEECLKILALHQPVAVDLRFIAAVIKINNDLERIGDEAVNIAERVFYLANHAQPKLSVDYTAMSEKAEEMVRKSLDALVKQDLDLAFQVLLMDDIVDEMYHKTFDRVKDAIKEEPENAGYLINLLSISRHLERIGDHATNIAEEVIYLIEGEIIRHT